MVKLRYLLATIGLAYSFVFLPITFAATENAGILRDGVWFSKEPLIAGETVNISTAIFNSTAYPITGIVAFKDGEHDIGAQSFTAGAGKLEQISVGWTPEKGEHRVSAEIISAVIREEGGGESIFTPQHIKTAIAVRTATAPLLPIEVSPTPKSTSGENITKTTVGFLENAANKISGLFDAEENTAPPTESKTFNDTQEKSIMNRFAGQVLGAAEEVNTNLSELAVKTRSALDKAKISLNGDDFARDKKTFTQVALAFLSAGSFVLGSSWFWWLVIAIVVFMLIRWLLGKFRKSE